MYCRVIGRVKYPVLLEPQAEGSRIYLANLRLVSPLRYLPLDHDAKRSITVLFEGLPFLLDNGCFRQNIRIGRIFPHVAQNLCYSAALSHMAELFAARDGFPASFGISMESIASVSLEA